VDIRITIIFENCKKDHFLVILWTDQWTNYFFHNKSLKTPKDYFLTSYDRKSTFFGCITIKENKIHFF